MYSDNCVRPTNDFDFLIKDLNLSSKLPFFSLIFLGSIILNIVLFRIFDSLKPWPISAIEKLKGGYGIILDDVMAGFFAAIVYYIILSIIPV